MNRRVHRTPTGEDGMALLAVVGIIALLTVVAFGSFALSQQTSHESVSVQHESQAFQAANAGIDAAVARLTAHGYIEEEYPLALSADELGSGSATVTMQPLGMYEYRCSSIGYGKDGSAERIIVQLFYLNIYAMNINAGEQGLTSGGQLAGNSSIVGPFYARGQIAATGGFCVELGPLFVKDGGITLNNNSAHIGTATEPIDLYCDGEINVKNYYVRNLSRSVPDIRLPRVNASYLQTGYLKALAESTDNNMGDPLRSTSPNVEASGGDPNTYTTLVPRAKCAGASAYYKYIGPASGPSAIGAGTTNLAIGETSFGRFEYDPSNPAAAGTAFDDFAYDATGSVLYVNGTVFIDGSLATTKDLTYKGNGTVICNGTITLGGRFRPAGGLTPDASGTPNQLFPPPELIGLVTPAAINLTGDFGNSNKDRDDPPDIACALFSSQEVQLTNNVAFAGSIIANQIIAPSSGQNPHIRTSPNLPDVLPESMPGRHSYLSTIGAWARR